MSFAELGLSEKVQQAVDAAGYTEPTPIQAQAIPHVLARRDVLGIAQTGTGKTAAFTLPMLTLLETGRARARMPRTLILEPTRELAAQVEDNFDKYGINHQLSVALLIGGVSFGDQDAKITRGVDVLIATPGRLLDHFERGKLLLTGVELLVIDEADRMLDMGFIPDIERIVKLVPFTRQTLFFSATMPPEIQRLADAFLHNPVKVEVARAASTASTIIQRLVATGPRGFREARDPARADPERDGPEERDRLLQPQARRRRPSPLPAEARLRGGRPPWRHGPACPHGGPRQLPHRRDADPGRQRRGGPRPRHSGGQPCLQLRHPAPRRGLRAPHRPHGPRRALGPSFTLVSPGDEKSLAAIEKLIGQPIAWEGPTLAERPASEGSSRRRGGRGERGEERSRGRKVRVRSSERSRERSEEPRDEAPVAREKPAPRANPAPREEQPSRRPRQERSERPERA